MKRNAMRKNLRQSILKSFGRYLAIVLIIALLAAGMSAGMTSGMGVYASAAFQSGSSSLAANINTTLSDILRYSTRYTPLDEENGPTFLITNLEYGMENCYIECPPYDEENDRGGIIQVCYWRENQADARAPKALVNSGSYGNLRVTDLTINPKSDAQGHYFEISYRIISTTDAASSRDVKTIVRMMNQ